MVIKSRSQSKNILARLKAAFGFQADAREPHIKILDGCFHNVSAKSNAIFKGTSKNFSSRIRCAGLDGQRWIFFAELFIQYASRTRHQSACTRLYAPYNAQLAEYLIAQSVCDFYTLPMNQQKVVLLHGFTRDEAIEIMRTVKKMPDCADTAFATTMPGNMAMTVSTLIEHLSEEHAEMKALNRERWEKAQKRDDDKGQKGPQ